ncbi:MAG: thiamine-monophosphate kinase [Verrucomicrobia bacterium]|nr:thiamine-monophosphate kinase [Verrucomicrobiota bacterium]
MNTLSDIGEDALIRRLTTLLPLAADPAAGPGDDCAVIDPGENSPTLTLLKTDALVEHVHYLPDAAASDVGWKAIARVVSDFSAMGGTPDRFLITLALPGETPVAWVESLYQGMAACMTRFGGLLAGGETTSVPAGSAKVISVAATGTVRREHLTLRSTANIGDAIFVTGTLGGSIRGKHLTFAPRAEAASWLANHAKPSAVMDISDGLAKDLPRLAAASGCGFRLDPRAIPVTPGCTLEQALGDGEDFELLITLPPGTIPRLSQWPAGFPALTRIGTITAADDSDNLTGGWEHFGKY